MSAASAVIYGQEILYVAARSRRGSTTCIPAGVSINDGREDGLGIARDRSVGMAEGYQDGDPPCSLFVVIPAQAGIQWFI